MRRLIIATFAIALIAAPAAARAETIKLATLAPKGSPWHEILEDMAAEWEEASGGAIKVRIYPGGVLGDEPTIVRKMQIGQIDGAMLTSAGLTRLVPEFWVFALPMMLANYEELDYVREAIGPRLKARFREKGFVVLNWGEAGWVRFFSNTPVVTPDDLRKIKLFVWASDPVLEDAWRNQKFDIVPLPATEIFSALQSGMIDAYSTTSVASLSFQWFGMAPYMLDLNWAPLAGGTILRVKTWHRLPEPVRARMLAAADKAGRRFRERTRDFEAEAVKVMLDNGLTVTRVPPEAYALWEKGAREASATIRERFVPPELADRVLRLRNEYRARMVSTGSGG